MTELNVMQMEEISGGESGVGCVLGVLFASLGIWEMAAVLAAASATGGIGTLGVITLILGPSAIAAAVISCSL